MRALRLAALIAVALAAPVAAEPPAPAPAVRLAAVAAADDATSAILVGPSGQIYAPDGHGAWLRTQAGGIGNTVVVATRLGAGVLAGADAAPPYRFDHGAWASIYLAMHAKAIVARGRRPVAAVGHQVFALDGGKPQALPDAPAGVTAIGASPAGIAIATERGVARLDGKRWKPVAQAPQRVRALASERWALTDDGAVDSRVGHGDRVAARRRGHRVRG